jgi:hypothetical protein
MRVTGKQSLARRRVLDYVSRLGLGSAARRLGTNVKTVETWIGSKFPREVLPDALAFSGSGGLYVAVKKTKTRDLVNTIGKRQAQKLLGIEKKELNQRIRRNRPIKFRRPQLAALVKKRGVEKVAKLLGATARNIDIARKPVPTAATNRLRTFVAENNRQKAATFVGVPESRIAHWLEWNVPRSWENALSQKLGRETWEKPNKATIETARRPTKREIERAKSGARGWNTRVGPKFRISAPEAEKQARLGRWDLYFALAKRAYETAKKKVVRKKQAPAPRLAPKAGPPPVIPGPPPRPRKRPASKIKTLPPELGTPEAIANLKELRAEAFFKGTAKFVDRYRNAPYGRTVKIRAPGVNGFSKYGKVEEMSHLTDLDALALKIIAQAKKLWKKAEGAGTMTVRMTFAAAGVGTPFYVEAWVPDADKITFFRNRTGRISNEDEIGPEVWGMINQVYDTGTSMLLFIEHYEIARSV